jgi:hypothetical protein
MTPEEIFAARKQADCWCYGGQFAPSIGSRLVLTAFCLPPTAYSPLPSTVPAVPAYPHLATPCTSRTPHRALLR